MRSLLTLLLTIAIAGLSRVHASIALPGLQGTSLSDMSMRPSYAGINDSSATETHFRRQLFASRRAPMAMAIPGYGIAEQVLVGGFGNFLQVFNYVITARILLSWIPQAQGVAILQPVFQITDPYLNLFRGIIPPVFGLDLSPLLAFFTLNLLTSSTAAVGHEIPHEMMKKGKKSSFGRAAL
eukprot:CAMPEP_0198270492 /NCGR_PEP_ID=MMETSP1447-20131203/45244_1 /TAXON_ID=420782 /ORGANISM="Chaetoceros dichaeta, Strain CCMP1751" /LENGTH=181 /DNA_ID=CAMNT_0043962549 /DNA_START=98 /DNA_END=643 /DNA_ORIENTATION=+